jgi:hypothetical protein
MDLPEGGSVYTDEYRARVATVTRESGAVRLAETGGVRSLDLFRVAEAEGLSDHVKNVLAVAGLGGSYALDASGRRFEANLDSTRDNALTSLYTERFDKQNERSVQVYPVASEGGVSMAREAGTSVYARGRDADGQTTWTLKEGRHLAVFSDEGREVRRIDVTESSPKVLHRGEFVFLDGRRIQQNLTATGNSLEIVKGSLTGNALVQGRSLTASRDFTLGGLASFQPGEWNNLGYRAVRYATENPVEAAAQVALTFAGVGLAVASVRGMELLVGAARLSLAARMTPTVMRAASLAVDSVGVGVTGAFGARSVLQAAQGDYAAAAQDAMVAAGGSLLIGGVRSTIGQASVKLIGETATGKISAAGAQALKITGNVLAPWRSGLESFGGAWTSNAGVRMVVGVLKNQVVLGRQVPVMAGDSPIAIGLNTVFQSSVFDGIIPSMADRLGVEIPTGVRSAMNLAVWMPVLFGGMSPQGGAIATTGVFDAGLRTTADVFAGRVAVSDAAKMAVRAVWSGVRDVRVWTADARSFGARLVSGDVRWGQLGKTVLTNAWDGVKSAPMRSIQITADVATFNFLAAAVGGTVNTFLLDRSEERRVGKECRRLCRSRWSPYH